MQSEYIPQIPQLILCLRFLQRSNGCLAFSKNIFKYFQGFVKILWDRPEHFSYFQSFLKILFGSLLASLCLNESFQCIYTFLQYNRSSFIFSDILPGYDEPWEKRSITSHASWFYRFNLSTCLRRKSSYFILITWLHFSRFRFINNRSIAEALIHWWRWDDIDSNWLVSFIGIIPF